MDTVRDIVSLIQFNTKVLLIEVLESLNTFQIKNDYDTIHRVRPGGHGVEVVRRPGI